MIIYNKLANHLKKNNMKWIDLQNALQVSPSIIAKFQKNRSVTTETIDKICTYLHIQPADMMEWVENENEAEKIILERQLKELQDKLKEFE